MVCALGLEDALVGVTHECDYPELVKRKPVVVRNVVKGIRNAAKELSNPFWNVWEWTVEERAAQL